MLSSGLFQGGLKIVAIGIDNGLRAAYCGGMFARQTEGMMSNPNSESERAHLIEDIADDITSGYKRGAYDAELFVDKIGRAHV